MKKLIAWFKARRHGVKVVMVEADAQKFIKAVELMFDNRMQYAPGVNVMLQAGNRTILFMLKEHEQAEIPPKTIGHTTARAGKVPGQEE